MGIEEIVEDWSGVKQRFQAWWQQDIADRPMLAVTAPRCKPDGELYAPLSNTDLSPAEVEAMWTDADVMVQRQEQVLQRTYFGGEALPLFFHNWSAGHALYFGCKPHFTSFTVWVDPAPVDAAGYPILEGWEDSPWWLWMQDCTVRSVQASRGRWFVLPVWGNNAGDTLGLVRGGEQLMEDITTHRAWVIQAIQKVSDIHIQAITRLWELVDPALVGVEGSIDYCGCWSPQRTMAFDCDLSCMLSPRDFNEIFLPPLRETMQTVQQRIYHLDGTVALQHLPTLLGLPELHAIQWVPGAGREAIAQWFPLIQRVQAAGKSIIIYVQPEEIPMLLKECRPEGLLINTSCANETEARALIERVKQ